MKQAILDFILAHWQWCAPVVVLFLVALWLAPELIEEFLGLLLRLVWLVLKAPFLVIRGIVPSKKVPPSAE